jgi:serine/threonine-protein kinase
MSRSDSEPTGFFAELKRRRVIPVAIIYGVVGVGVVEAAELFLPRLQAPDWIITLLVVLVVVGFPVILVRAWIYDLTPEGLRRSEWIVGGGEAVERRAPAGAAVAGEADGRGSIAVLPFADMSPDHDQEYFGDGMAEELIDALTKVDGLRVAARTSSFAFKGKEEDICAIGVKLRVGSVLEGSVRKAGNRLRITAQLISVADGYHLWSETYDRELEDVFAIQDEISRAIVGALQLKLAVGEGESLAPPSTRNMEAYDLYLKGRHYWYLRFRGGLQTALGCFEKAIEKDPEYALPHTGVALTYSILGAVGFIPPDHARRTAQAAADRALAIDETESEVQHAAAAVKFWLLWDWDGAEQQFERAVELNPAHAEALDWWSVVLALRGRFAESSERAARARAAAPESAFLAIGRGLSALWARRHEEAIAELEWALEREPAAANALWMVGAVYSAVSKHEEAIAAHEKAVALTDRAPWSLGLLGASYGQAGMEREAETLLDELRERSEHEYVAPASLAIVWASLGRTEETLRCLEAAADEKSPLLLVSVRAHVLDGVRSDERFAAILKRMGLDA